MGCIWTGFIASGTFWHKYVDEVSWKKWGSVSSVLCGVITSIHVFFFTIELSDWILTAGGTTPQLRRTLTLVETLSPAPFLQSACFCLHSLPSPSSAVLSRQVSYIRSLEAFIVRLLKLRTPTVAKYSKRESTSSVCGNVCACALLSKWL